MKNIIITGGSRGLGLCHAKYLAKNGYNIHIIDISKRACAVYDEVESISSLLDVLNKTSNSKFYSCDLTDFKSTSFTINKILNICGNLHGAVLNAGGDIKGADNNASGGKAENNSLEINIDDYDNIFNRNYKTCLNTLKCIIPFLKKQNFGKIITTSSVSAGYGVDKETAYSTAKAAIMHLTRSAASELRPFDISVNCIAPGPTMTGRFKSTLKNRSVKDLEKINSNGSFLTKVADPIQVSFLVEFLLSEKSNYITGQVIRIDGGQFTAPI